MPTVHSVSDITNILSGIIQSESILQDVSVQGEVSSMDDPPGVFWLKHGKNRIRCFIPGPNTAQFGAVLIAGNRVVVKGNIQIFPAFSEYQIRVADVLPIIKLPKVNQQLTVSGIMASLLSLIQNSSDLQGIQVHGNISNFDSNPKRAFWFLSDTNIVNPQRIHCVFFEADGMAVGNGDQVRAEGNIQIWGAHSRYQINIAEVQLDDGTPRCECSGCGSCQQIGAAPPCSALRDPKYELCPACYVNSPDHEDRVVEVVNVYFSGLGVPGFSPKTEHGIQIGSENCRADVVLADENGSFAAIAECKGAGYVGHGIEQLKSYLSATDTRFGIFANGACRRQWKFYENRRHNQFDCITLDQFEEGIAKGITLRKQLKDQIKSLESNRNQFRDEIDDLKTEKAEAATQVRQESQKLDVLKQAIESDHACNQSLKSTQKHLSDEINQLKANKDKLKTGIEKLERKESELHASRKQWKEKIQQFETFLSDMKSDLLDSESSPQSEDNVGPQKTRGQKKQSIVKKLKNLFSKENE